jgi:tetratricopeptide (TPR) repeat protein
MQDTTPVRRFSFDSAAVWLVAVTAFLAIVALIPGYPVSLFGTKVTLIAVIALIALIAYIVARLSRGNIVFPPLALLGVVWLLPVAYGLSTLFSGANPLSSVFGVEMETDTFGFILLLALLATLAALALRQASHYQLFFRTLAVSFVLVVLAQIGFIIAAKAGVGISASANLVGSFSDLALFAGLAIALSLLAHRFLTLGKRVKMGLWVGVVLALIVLVLANSALAWTLTALVALALFIEAVMKRRGAHSDADLDGAATFAIDEEGSMNGGASSLGVPLVTLLVSLFFLIGGATIGNAFAGALGVNVIDVRPSWQSTFDVGSHTYASSPLFGSGPGTFGTQWLKFRDRSLNDTIFWSVDFASGIGYIPTSFVTTGIVGAIAWIVFIGFFLYTAVRALLFRLPQDEYMRFVSLASATGAFYILVASFFSAPGPVMLALGFMLLGVFISSLRFGKGRLDWGIVFAKSPRIGFAIVFLMTILLLGSVGSLYLVLVRHMSAFAYGEGSVALAAGNLDAAEADANQSISFAPSERAYQLLAAISMARMQKVATDTTLAATTAQTQFQAALTSAVNAGLAATALGPNNYQNWLTLGSVYQLVVPLNITGSYQSAKDAYEHAEALNPTSPVLPYIVSQLEIGNKDTQAAETALLASVSLKRDYIPSILLLSQLEVQLGKATEALQAAEAAAYFAPDEPSVLFQVGILRYGTGDVTGAVTALAHAVEVNPQYANARYFLGAMYSLQGKYDDALKELRAVAAMSDDNATAVAADIASLEAGKNPFPASRLKSLGIPTPPVEEPSSKASTETPAKQ